IANKGDSLIGRNDRAFAMPLFEVKSERCGLAPPGAVGILQDRDQVRLDVRRLLPQRLGHDKPVMRNAAIAEQRAQLQSIRRRGRSDQAIPVGHCRSIVQCPLTKEKTVRAIRALVPQPIELLARNYESWGSIRVTALGSMSALGQKRTYAP